MLMHLEPLDATFGATVTGIDLKMVEVTFDGSRPEYDLDAHGRALGGDGHDGGVDQRGLTTGHIEARLSG